MDSQVIAKNIADEFSSFDTILWGALGSRAVNPQRRTKMVLDAFSNLRNFMTGVLSSVGKQKIVKPGGQTATSGKGVSTMTSMEKWRQDWEVAQAKIAALQADPANAAFFGKGGTPVSKANVAEAPLVVAVKKAVQNNDLTGAFRLLQEAFAELAGDIDTIEAKTDARKALATDLEKPFDGVFSRYNERQKALVQLCKDARAERKAKAAMTPEQVWDGVWSGRA